MSAVEGTLFEHSEAAETARLGAARLAERLLASEAAVSELREEAATTASMARSMKASGKDCVDAVSAHKALLRKTSDEIDRRHEAYDQAFANLSEMLKVGNPLAAALCAVADATNLDAGAGF